MRVRGKAATHHIQNASLQLLIVAGLGIFQGRVKLEVYNAKRQEEQGDLNRQLLRSLSMGGGGKRCARAGAVAGSSGGGFRAGD